MLKRKMNGGGGLAKSDTTAMVNPFRGKGLSELDKFDKKIKVKKVAKEIKPVVKAFNKAIKAAPKKK
jgi:hypothetical protein